MKKSLRNKEIKELVRLIEETYSIKFSRKEKFEIDEDIVLVNGHPFFFYHEKELVPTLKLILENNVLKTITVDMGAVKFVVKGADIMRPGITKIDDTIESNELVTIIDEKHNKPIGIGLALFSGQEMQKATSGKVVKNLHYVGDKIWNLKI